MKAVKGMTVQIHSIILKPEERTASIPDDTKSVPVEMWVKGILDKDAETGDTVTVTTAVGRQETGVLCAVEPRYVHDYGDYVPEIDEMRRQIKSVLGV
jgi:hypothetical protein